MIKENVRLFYVKKLKVELDPQVPHFKRRNHVI